MNNCKNCGAPYGLHHADTDQCPHGGHEAPIGQKQLWRDTTFEEFSDTITDKKIVEQKLIKWFGDMPAVLYLYDFDDTYVYTVKWGRAIYIIRIFLVFNRWELSQDAMIYPKDGSGLPELEVQK